MYIYTYIYKTQSSTHSRGFRSRVDDDGHVCRHVSPCVRQPPRGSFRSPSIDIYRYIDAHTAIYILLVVLFSFHPLYICICTTAYVYSVYISLADAIPARADAVGDVCRDKDVTAQLLSPAAAHVVHARTLYIDVERKAYTRDSSRAIVMWNAWRVFRAWERTATAAVIAEER